MHNEVTSSRPQRHTQLYFVRHAHSHWTPDERRPLSSAGARAAEVVTTRLATLPIAAIYSSPSRRTIDTVAPLAARLGVTAQLVADLRERELPEVPVADFERIVYETWRLPERAPYGGEPNLLAQARGLATVRHILAQHPGEHVVVSTHGTLLALILNGLDEAFDYGFWQRMSFPDIYGVSFERDRLLTAERMWQPDVQIQPATDTR